MAVAIVVVVGSAVTAATAAITGRTDALARCMPACSGCLQEGGDMSDGQEETVLADPAMVAAWAKEAVLEGLQTANESNY